MAKLTVYLIEASTTRITETVRTAAQKAVEAQLKTLPGASKKDEVRLGFDVVWRKKLLSSEEIKALTETEFVVYLIEKNDATLATTLYEKHAGKANAESVRADLQAQLKS